MVRLIVKVRGLGSGGRGGGGGGSGGRGGKAKEGKEKLGFASFGQYRRASVWRQPAILCHFADFASLCRCHMHSGRWTFARC